MMYQPPVHASRDEAIASPDPAYLKYTLTQPSSSFYTDFNQSMTPMIGYESGARHFGHALEYLNHHLNMQLDTTDVKVFELLLTSLAQANRFSGDLHICPVLGENSAVHTLRTLILDTEVARRAGNLSYENQRDTSVSRQRIRRLRAILTHDMGEIPGEMTSLAARTRNAALQELPDIERDVFRIHLTEAYRTALSSTPNYPQFYRFQGEIRRAVAAAQVDDEKSQVAMATKLKAIVSRYDSAGPATTLPPHIQGRIHEWMYDFDTIEIKDEEAPRETLFTGFCGKISEHLQGTRHLLRFGTIHPEDNRLNLVFPQTHQSAARDPLSQSDPKAMIPLRYLSNMRLIKAFRYMETELQGLFAHASSEHEFRHARALRDMVFLTQVEWLSVGRPICDRRVLQKDPKLQVEDTFLVQLQDQIRACADSKERNVLMRTAQSYLHNQLQKDLDETRKHRASSQNTSAADNLFDLETRSRMQALYLHAIREDYIPDTSTPLLLLGTLPKSLHGFTRSRPYTDSVTGAFAAMKSPARWR